VRKSGFTLIELMVAMVIGLTAITSVYTLGSAMSKQFYEEQRLATSQGTSRVAIMELRRDISRAGLFGSPNGQKEPTCDASPPTLPLLSGGSTGPMGAFQYYPNHDLSVLDPQSNNPEVNADRLRILTSLYLTDQLLVHSASVDGSVIVLQSGNQAYRRTFAWGQSAGPFTTGTEPTYLDGTLDWDSAWAGATASWNGIAQKGARAFQTGSLLHIETPEGRHFFRSVFNMAGRAQDEIRMTVTPVLPVGTACLPGAAEGATVAPLQWVEYAIVDPTTVDGGAFYSFTGMFLVSTDPNDPAFELSNIDSNDLLEAPNRVLVRRILNSADGTVRANTTQIIAEFVTNFSVSFLLDTNSGSASAATLSGTPVTGTSAQSAVNARPEEVRSVIIDLGIRNPLEDPTIEKLSGDGGTRFDVDDTSQVEKGSARVRHMRIEIPVMNVARRNL
jgi:prepilin-type N-terminal cleavage/methylation domain-containing protein